MKKRLYFVANSSSESFICDICGNKKSGWDASASDLYMAECESGHVICQCHISEEDEKMILDYNSSIDVGWDNCFNYDSIPAKHCPVCKFESVCSHDVISYLSKKYGIKFADLKMEIQETFGIGVEARDKFEQYLKEV